MTVLPGYPGVALNLADKCLFERLNIISNHFEHVSADYQLPWDSVDTLKLSNFISCSS